MAVTSESTTAASADTDPHQSEAAGTTLSRPRRSMPWTVVVAILAVIAVIALQIVSLRTAGDARSAADEASARAADALAEAERTGAALDALEATVGDLEQELDLANLAVPLDNQATSDLGADPSLPPYPSAGPDIAVAEGLAIAAIEGDEYYSDETLTIIPDGETATVWLVWAHWCPHCQNDLPVLQDVWVTAAPDLPHVQIVTITTAIDESRGNPLIPYLEASQFAFPVLVDTDGSLAAKLGTNAFPFWVITGPDGRVILRRPGALGPDQIQGLLFDLEDFASR